MNLLDQARARLEVIYEEGNKWRLEYHRTDDHSTIALVNFYSAGQACAQVRGMLADFATTQQRKFVCEKCGYSFLGHVPPSNFCPNDGTRLQLVMDVPGAVLVADMPGADVPAATPIDQRDEALRSQQVKAAHGLAVRRERGAEWARRTGSGPGQREYIEAYLRGYFNEPATSSRILEAAIIEQFEAEVSRTTEKLEKVAAQCEASGHKTRAKMFRAIATELLHERSTGV